MPMMKVYFTLYRFLRPRSEPPLTKYPVHLYHTDHLRAWDYVRQAIPALVLPPPRPTPVHEMDCLWTYARGGGTLHSQLLHSRLLVLPGFEILGYDGDRPRSLYGSRASAKLL